MPFVYETSDTEGPSQAANANGRGNGNGNGSATDGAPIASLTSAAQRLSLRVEQSGMNTSGGGSGTNRARQGPPRIPGGLHLPIPESSSSTSISNTSNNPNTSNNTTTTISATATAAAAARRRALVGSPLLRRMRARRAGRTRRLEAMLALPPADVDVVALRDLMVEHQVEMDRELAQAKRELRAEEAELAAWEAGLEEEGEDGLGEADVLVDVDEGYGEQ